MTRQLASASYAIPVDDRPALYGTREGPPGSLVVREAVNDPRLRLHDVRNSAANNIPPTQLHASGALAFA